MRAWAAPGRNRARPGHKEEGEEEEEGEMGNCGTREENAVVAAHAQGIHPFRFAPGFSWADSCRWLFGLDLRLGISNCIGISSLLDYLPAPSWRLFLLVGGLTVTVDVVTKNAFFLGFLLRCRLVYL